MREIRQEISKELYSEYHSMRYPERSEIIKEHVPIEWLYGYGYYGHRLSAYGGKFYVVHTVGDTCD